MLEDQLDIDMGNVNHVQKLGMLKVVHLLDTSMVFGLVQVVKMADLDSTNEVVIGLMVQKIFHMIGNGKTNQDIENVVVCVLEVVVIHIHSKHFHANFGDMSQNMALVLGKNVGHNRPSDAAQMSKVSPFDNSSLHSLGRDLL
ncbi:hypothetical protein PIB30_096933 [Stylosanthes scabra]|uniref:Uncharacterized protein n=1 Tax=Stylosanthes scabra TaxID=79078 RepID=A0ABU6UYM6_9FABA|nr:hypothetical protein [Stylosanthes scabra]